jgi:hypothetical protein
LGHRCKKLFVIEEVYLSKDEVKEEEFHDDEDFIGVEPIISLYALT